jgi:hypothetical protein
MWIAMNAAHVRTEDTISTISGFTGDFADFSIASYLDAVRWS